MNKVCSDCGETKPITRFNRAGARDDPERRRGDCVDCCVRKTVARRKKDPTWPSRRRGHLLKNKYGITLEEYNEMYRNQSGKCLICSRHFEQLNVDHCHDSMKVRGLLCGPCNSGIGYLGDDISRLQSAIAYLERGE